MCIRDSYDGLALVIVLDEIIPYQELLGNYDFQIIDNTLRCIIPVSYTHLDVYKRQGLIRCGSRIFDKAEQPKTGDSLAAPRREARSARRRLRRRRDVYKRQRQGWTGLAAR